MIVDTLEDREARLGNARTARTSGSGSGSLVGTSGSGTGDGSLSVTSSLRDAEGSLFVIEGGFRDTAGLAEVGFCVGTATR